MPLVLLPEQRQDALVAEHGLPGRLEQQRVRRRQVAAEFLPEQVLERVELEQGSNHAVLEIGEAAVGTDADVLDVEQAAFDACLDRAIAQVVHGTAILGRIAHRGKVERPWQGRRQRGEGLDQTLVDRIELVGGRRQTTFALLVVEPLPLEERRLEQRRRRVVVELEQFGRAPSRIGQVHATVQVRLAGAPASRNEVPERFGNIEPAQLLLAADDAIEHVDGHGMQFLGRRLDVGLDLFQAEGVEDRLVPVAVAVDRMEVETRLQGTIAPVGALGNRNPAHSGTGAAMTA